MSFGGDYERIARSILTNKDKIQDAKLSTYIKHINHYSKGAHIRTFKPLVNGQETGG